MRRRIVICLGLLLALCLVGNATALLSLNSSIQRFGDLAERQRIQALRVSLNLSGLQVERDLLAQRLGVPGTDEQLRDSIWYFRDSLRQCHNCHHGPVVEARLSQVRETFDTWLAQSDPTGPAGHATENPVADTSPLNLADQVVVMTAEMATATQKSLEAKGDEVKVIVHRTWVTLWLTLVAVLVSGGIIAFHLHQRLTRPFSELQGLIRQSRHGDLRDAPPISGDAEFRQLGLVFSESFEELHNAQAGVLEAQKMAAIGQLAAGVAHEVLNPLTGISCVVQILRDEERSPRDVERLDLVMDHIARITKIVRDFRHFSQPTEGDEWTLVSVSSLLEQATELLGYDQRSEGITIAREFASDLDPIKADADRLGVVFTNLMLNAIDALAECEEDEPILTVSARRVGEMMVVSVADNGPGMTEHSKANAFEPFFTTKSAGAGTGLGLWVCYEVVRGHGGKISFDDRPGGGLVVTVELPIERQRPES